MRKQLLTVLCCLALLAISSSSNAQSTLIHYWHFNNYNQGAMYTPTINAIPADYTDLPGSNPRILYTTIAGTSSSYSTYIDSLTAISTDNDTVNLRMGQPSGMVIRARNPSDSMQLLFYIPTTHFSNIVINYGSEASSTTHGQAHQVFSYSPDGGTTWRTSGLSIPSDSAWLFFHRTTVAIADPSANNNPNLVFRIIFSGNTTGTSGNNRFDNVTVEGDSITSTTGIAQVIAQPATFVTPNPVTETLNIKTTLEGDKLISIYNSIGQNVYAGNANDKEFAINVSSLSTGNYYLNISEIATGKVSTLKFTKQ